MLEELSEWSKAFGVVEENQVAPVDDYVSMASFFLYYTGYSLASPLFQ